MSKVKIKKSNVNYLNFFIILVFALSVIFVPTANDPFNNPKFWILLFGGAFLLGFQLKSLKYILHNNFALFFTVVLFILSMIISSIFGRFHYATFFGDTQRRVGFITLLTLVFFFAYFIRFFELVQLNKIHIIVLCTSTIINIYGFIQSRGLDFINWNNPYNSIIGTLGNPNFASALMAVLSSYLIMDLIFSKRKFINFILQLVLILVSIANIISSQSRQGAIALFVGMSSAIGIKLIVSKHKYRFIYLISVIFVYIFGILGMLQIGPFQTLLYKESVSVRGFYWRAAISMWKANPFFGVGLDSYGYYFKQFRELNYPLRYGFELTSNNAHSIPLQYLATGGIFMFLSYVFLIGLIFVFALRNLKVLTGNEQIFCLAIFSAWISYQSQSIISIENIGLAIWGWTFSGILVAINFRLKFKENKDILEAPPQYNKISELERVVALICSLVILIPIGFLLNADKSAYKTRSLYIPTSKSQELKAAFLKSATQSINDRLQDPSLQVLMANYLKDMGYIEDGRTISDNLFRNNPKNIYFLNSVIYDAHSKNDLNLELNLRKKLEKIDPFNLDNLVKMAVIYKTQGNSSSYLELENSIRNSIRGYPNLKYLLDQIKA